MIRILRLWLSSAITLIVAALLVAAIVVTPGGFAVTAFATGVASGTSMAFAPDGRLFVCEQAGLLELYGPSGAYVGTFHNFTGNIDATFERGLLGVAIDPDFGANGHVYCFRTRATPTLRNQVIRLTSAGNASDGSETLILDLEDLGATNHNGGALHFGPDGKLYVAQGENAVAANSMLLTNRFGKILRINPNGTIPADNPAVIQGLAGSPAGVNQSIWAVGLRNPFTFAFDPLDGRMFINDVGAAAWEEINVGVAGANYGWAGGSTDGPRLLASYTDPLYAYGHSGGPPAGLAITGGVFYRPPVPQFPAAYVGQYFFADVSGGWIYVLDPATGLATGFSTGTNQLVDLDVGPDGALYALDRLSSSVRRVAYTAVVTQAILVSAESVAVNEGAGATFGVRLAIDPGTPATVSTALLLSDPTLAVSPPTLTFTTGDFATYQVVTVTAAADADLFHEGGTVELASAGLAARTVTVTVLDDDPPMGAPLAEINLPKNGLTVAGPNAELFGQVTNGAPTTQAQFFADGALIHLDAGPGHYHAGGGHAAWNTTALSDGPHLIRMEVSDGTFTTGHEIRVEIANGAVLPPGDDGGSEGCGRCGLTGFEILLIPAAWWLARRRS